jgi:two-component system LytT family response regulator
MQPEFCIFVEKIFMIKIILVEPANQICEIVIKSLDAFRANMELVATIGDIKDAISAIDNHEPDLVITDIKLEGGSGFELIDHFERPDFKVILISAHIDYAVKAFKYNAIDYLLKPVKEEELVKALRKADDLIRYEEKLQSKALGQSITDLNKSHRLVLKSQDHVHVVDAVHIVHIEAYGNYSTFYLEDGRKVVVSRPMREYEDTLLEFGFHRVHKSHLVNINQMQYFDKADGGTLVMVNGDEVPVASRKKDMLMELFENLT